MLLTGRRQMQFTVSLVKLMSSENDAKTQE